MESFKDLILHKLSLRIIYIVAAYSTSHIVALAESPHIQNALSKIPGLAISFKVTDVHALENWITATMLIGGEFVYHFVHNKFILPQVSPQATIQPQSNTATNSEEKK